MTTGSSPCGAAAARQILQVGGRRRQNAVTVLLAVLVGAVALLALAAGPSLAGSEDPEPSVHTPWPAPGALVPAGEGELGAYLHTPAGVESVAITLGGEPAVDVRRGPPEPQRGTPVRVPVELSPGTHEVRVAFTDAEGRAASRTWEVTATGRSHRRLAGDERVGTAVAVASDAFPEPASAGAAVLARADDFADALTGAPLAAAVDGPLLLTGRDGLPDVTAAELGRVLHDGATVHLLGGPAALGEEVVRAVAALGFEPVRHAGADRVATAAEVAGVLPRTEEVLVASAADFPDALAASVPAARDGLPVLLTEPDGLPEATTRVLGDLKPSRATVIGGPAAVSDAALGQLAASVDEVERVAGPDRYATAVAVLEARYPDPSAVSLASGAAFPDALAGAPHAAAQGQPVLLTAPDELSAPTAEALRVHRPVRLDVYGGPAAIAESVVDAGVAAAEDGPGAPRSTGGWPASGATVSSLAPMRVDTDRRLDPTRSSLHVELSGFEVPGEVELAAEGAGLVFRPAESRLEPAPDTPHPLRLTAALVDVEGRRTHHVVELSYLRPDPHFATAPPVELLLPSRGVEMIGYHQANHHGAQQQIPRGTAIPTLTLASRGRETGSRTAADVVADPAEEVLAPATGTVVRGGTYLLYCAYTDEFVVIEPDARPGWEVKVLHVHGLGVEVGDRVEAGRTVIADGPRPLPFASQVDAHSNDRDWPHVHVEVVDPSVPTPPGRGC